MRWFFFILLILAAAILEAGNLLNLIAFSQGQIRPSVLTILLVFFSLRGRPEQAVACSFAVGFAADLAGSVMGPHTICFGLIGSILSQTQGMLTLRRPAYQVAVVLVASLLAALSSQWLALLKTAQQTPVPFTVLAGSALYTAAVAPVLWPLLNLLWKSLIKPRSPRGARDRIGHV